MVNYVPARGDIVWLKFDPQQGKEIKKTRPALVISPKDYNKKVGLALFMPITSQIKGYPFEVVIKLEGKDAAIISDQVRSLDWRARQAEFISLLQGSYLADALARFSLLVK
jgi:mRNA interferase MazF